MTSEGGPGSEAGNKTVSGERVKKKSAESTNGNILKRRLKKKKTDMKIKEQESLHLWKPGGVLYFN